MKRKSLGMIETWGIVAAINAADAGCKAAVVDLVGYELNSGRGNIKFVGDVAAVQAAVAAARAAAERVGRVISVTVIPRPDGQLDAVTIESPDNVPPVVKAPPVPLEDPAPEEPPSEQAEEEATGETSEAGDAAPEEEDPESGPSPKRSSRKRSPRKKDK